MGLDGEADWEIVAFTLQNGETNVICKGLKMPLGDFLWNREPSKWITTHAAHSKKLQKTGEFT